MGRLDRAAVAAPSAESTSAGAMSSGRSAPMRPRPLWRVQAAALVSGWWPGMWWCLIAAGKESVLCAVQQHRVQVQAC